MWRALLLTVKHKTAMWLGINSCSEERLLVLKGGSHGWFWQIHRTAVEIIWACSWLLFSSADNSTLRSLVLIIYFHLIFQDEIIPTNDTWWGAKRHTGIDLRQRGVIGYHDNSEGFSCCYATSFAGYLVSVILDSYKKQNIIIMPQLRGKNIWVRMKKSCTCLCWCWANSFRKKKV